jgi:hypothetical protein
MLVLKVAEGKFIYSQYVKEILNQILINIQYSELNVSISKGDHFNTYRFDLSDKKYIRLVYLWKPI